MNQQALFNQTRFETWKKFHAENPQVFELFKRFARQALKTGRPRFSARVIGERIPWETSVETKSDDGFKVNDHHWPYYARLIAALDPRFNEFFVFKNQRFDATPKEILKAHRE